MLEGAPPSRVLNVGCSGGRLAEAIRERGHHVTGIDAIEVPGVRDRTDAFVQADLSRGFPAEVGGDFDIVVAGDIIEHLPRPTDTLREIRALLRPGGQLLLSVPNFGHWYPRARVAFGLFGYDRRGIQDETHLRFFTRRVLRRIVQRGGFDILDEQSTGLPFTTMSDTDGPNLKALRGVDNGLVRLRPTLFGYQWIMRLTPHAEEALVVAG
jgi:2-polyprenyl-3-methyl-5-hydroxy-6-metoxy-1,4-benzoquinol methylase